MAMSAPIPSRAFLAAFLPVARATIFPPPTQRLPLLQRLRASIALPPVFLPIPGIIDTIWEGILKAVPKKKTSHMKKRHRFMAGKALKDVTALNKCSSCGRLKRAHVLCPYCVASVKRWFVSKLGVQKTEDTPHYDRRGFVHQPLQVHKKRRGARKWNVQSVESEKSTEVRGMVETQVLPAHQDGMKAPSTQQKSSL